VRLQFAKEMFPKKDNIDNTQLKNSFSNSTGPGFPHSELRMGHMAEICERGAKK
jgi:hypothetical protein